MESFDDRNIDLSIYRIEHVLPSIGDHTFCCCNPFIRVLPRFWDPDYSNSSRFSPKRDYSSQRVLADATGGESFDKQNVEIVYRFSFLVYRYRMIDLNCYPSISFRYFEVYIGHPTYIWCRGCFGFPLHPLASNSFSFLQNLSERFDASTIEIVSIRVPVLVSDIGLNIRPISDTPTTGDHSK